MRGRGEERRRTGLDGEEVRLVELFAGERVFAVVDVLEDETVDTTGSCRGSPGWHKKHDTLVVAVVQDA